MWGGICNIKWLIPVSFKSWDVLGCIWPCFRSWGCSCCFHYPFFWNNSSFDSISWADTLYFTIFCTDFYACFWQGYLLYSLKKKLRDKYLGFLGTAMKNWSFQFWRSVLLFLLVDVLLNWYLSNLNYFLAIIFKSFC